MLRVIRRNIDNYIKGGKLKLVRINKRYHFPVTEVKGMIHVPETPKIKNYHDDIQTMLQQVARMNELGEDW